MAVPEWTAKSIVPGIYTDEYAPLIVIANQEVNGLRFIVWAWLRGHANNEEWTVHKCSPDVDFLDHRWKRTLKFKKPE